MSAASELPYQCSPHHLISLIEMLCDKLDCAVEDLGYELDFRKRDAEDMMRYWPMYASWKGKCYKVHSRTLSEHPADTMQCSTHKVTIDVDYKENYGVELKHPELPCVVSDHELLLPVLYPLEVVYVDLI